MVVQDSATATINNYLRGVRHLILHFNKLPEQCDVNEIKQFLVGLKNHGLSSSSVNLRVCGLKFYFRHVVNRLDLVTGIPNPRIPKYDTQILDAQELISIFKVCKDVRQLLIVQILFDTGLRSFELLKLEFKDFDKHNRTISVRGKGKRIRVVPYGSRIRKTLCDYVKVLGHIPQGPILKSYKYKNEPLSKRGIQHIVREIAKRSGIKKKISCHTYRHSFAVHFLNNGGHLAQLQQLLGHEHITTTLNYIKFARIPFNQITTPLDKLLNDQNEA